MTNSKPPRIGLVTVTYNSSDVIEPFLRCVREQTCSEHLLVIVDNASRDDTLRRVREQADERVCVIANAENLGVAAANNQGIERCREAGIEWILLVNNDTEFPQQMLDHLLASASELGARVLVPRITYFERPDLDWYAGGYFSWLRGFQARHIGGKPRDTGGPRPTLYAPTCCMLVHTSVFEQVGTMDPAYFVYWDDTDFCWRLARHSVAIHYDPRIALAHKVSTLTGGPQSAFSVRYYSRNQVYFLRKHFSRTVVGLNVLWIRLKNRIRLWTGRDDSTAAALRRAAIADGLRMPISGSS